MKPWVVTYKDAKSLVICGDIHGLVYEMCVRYGMHDTLVIVAGDCGFGFEKPGAYDLVFRRIEKRLAQNNCCGCYLGALETGRTSVGAVVLWAFSYLVAQRD